jgi:hypothetical protein
MYFLTEVYKKELNHGLQRGIERNCRSCNFVVICTDMQLVTRTHLCSCRDMQPTRPVLYKEL